MLLWLLNFRSSRSIVNAEADEDEDEGSSDGGGVEIDEHGNLGLYRNRSARV